MSALIDGLIAGYGIAIPLGAISVLIVARSIDQGFRIGFWAGAGTATVDALCAALVVFAGFMVSSILGPISGPLAVVGGVILILMGAYGMWKAWKVKGSGPEGQVDERSARRTYFQFIGLTIFNPFTALYFLALIMGGSTGWITSTADCVLFVIGVTLASLSWQTLLAGVGAVAQKHMNIRMKVASMLIGNAIVVLLGLNLMLV